MVEPLHINEQMRQAMFIPDHTLALFFGMSKFDNVYKQTKNGGFEPYFENLPEAKDDCDDLKNCLKHYNLAEENCYDLSNNPTLKEI